MILFNWEPVDIIAEHHFFDKTLIATQLRLGLKTEQISSIINVIPQVMVLLNMGFKPIFGGFIQLFSVIPADEAIILQVVFLLLQLVSQGTEGIDNNTSHHTNDQNH